MKGRVRLRPVFSSPARAHRFWADVAAQLADVDGVTVQDGDYPGQILAADEVHQSPTETGTHASGPHPPGSGPVRH